MNNRLIEHIISDFRQYGKPILIVEDINGFLARQDVRDLLTNHKILVNSESNLSQRIAYHSSDNSTLNVFISNAHQHLEDILQKASHITFNLSQYLGSYHLPSILPLDLNELDWLYQHMPIKKLSSSETQSFLLSDRPSKDSQRILPTDIFTQIVDQLNRDEINWQNVLSLFSNLLIDDPDHFHESQFRKLLEEANSRFQKHLERDYRSFPNSNSIIKPKVVSKVLDHIAFNYKDDKVALVVVDGLSYWQYKMLSKVIPNKFATIEEVTYAWIPTITQLSRQALFRGGIPDKEYVQNPTKEKKLWYNYWLTNGFSTHEIDYQHDPGVLNIGTNTRRLGIVFKDLDDKMHSSTDYKDLKSLTEHWFERSRIVSFLENLIAQGFKVILTTDHGNIEAEGWRTLTGREKLGTNKSGSRSTRHIEYTEGWLVRDFLEDNEEIRDSLVLDEQAIYFKDNKSFSSEEHLVTHGGSHLFEVLIPFIKISKD